MRRKPFGILIAAIRLAICISGTVHSLVDVPTNCLKHTDVTGTYDAYYQLDAIGNVRSDANPVDLTMYVEVRNLQEEIAILLSSQNRSLQYPDFAQTYEIRISNVYTVIYRETLKMQAYHSVKEKLFPGETFKVRFSLTSKGNITVVINDNEQRPLLNVYDERQILDVQYISFASRMNAYPISFYIGCREPDPDAPTSTENALASVCPVCPKQRCEVIVKACSDSTKDAASLDVQKEKYYFHFDLLLSKNKNKNVLA